MSKLKEKVLKLVKDKKFIAGFILIIAAFAIFAINNQDPTAITVYGDIFYLKNNKLYTQNSYRNPLLCIFKLPKPPTGFGGYSA